MKRDVRRGWLTKEMHGARRTEATAEQPEEDTRDDLRAPGSTEPAEGGLADQLTDQIVEHRLEARAAVTGSGESRTGTN